MSYIAGIIIYGFKSNQRVRDTNRMFLGCGTSSRDFVVVKKKNTHAHFSHRTHRRYVGTRPTIRILSPAVGYKTRTKRNEVPLSFVLFKEPADFNESDLVSSVPSDRFESFHVAAHDDRIYSAVLHLDTNIDGGRSVFVNDSVFTDLYVLSHIY